MNDQQALAARLAAVEETCWQLSLTVARLDAQAAITDVLYRFNRGLDRRDEGLMLSAFHADAGIDYGRLFTGAARDFVTSAMQAQRPGSPAQHMIGNILVRLETADRATVESYEIAHHPAGHGPEADMMLASRLLDRFERRGGEWRIASRTKVGDWARLLMGSDGLYADLPITKATRDATDASYALFQTSR